MAMFDRAAEAFDRHAADSAYNAHYDRPALLELLGDVAGLHILDAGCGSGHYAAELLARGASVVGVDASSELIRLARRRAPEAEFHVQPLEEPLDWLADRSVDRVLMALVLHHLHYPVEVLRELHRVLADDGRLVLSTGHPTDDWRRRGGSYFTTERIEETWSMGLQVAYRRAPLSTLTDEFAEAGFVVEKLVEPRPTETMKQKYPEAHEKLSRVPAFIAFQLMKHPGSIR
ncbi:class I SAM-dependent methyltransferase [Corynebacterium sp.]|uniref:class I SAM-dependent methyltransferase n=1 Tax=Corynebacterium sp. TaxID=1720 RepID=UPI0026DF02F3|nr:class I SAM-dependent methyltransferase [Corynebacterium sp.]MDO5511478.1 class I SAM-dependent methyltransferase [Corynebacterium sp.]